MDDRIPIQKTAKIIKALLLSRLHVMVLHRYHNGLTSRMPERLRNILLASGCLVLETSVAFETLPECRNWAWYSGAFQQYHAAFLLLMEVYIYPHRQEADRIWTCLDYVFECQPNEPRNIKAKRILAELQQKTAIYQSMRGMRAPLTMHKHLGQRPPRIADPRGSISSATSASPEPPVNPNLHIFPGQSQSIGRAQTPMPEMVFAGISNGESLWALPNQASPESSSDANSVPGQHQSASMPALGTDDLMADIDWEAFDAMFPPDQLPDHLNPPDFQIPIVPFDTTIHRY